jgi:Ras-related protein Rab-6A
MAAQALCKLIQQNYEECRHNLEQRRRIVNFIMASGYKNIPDSDYIALMSEVQMGSVIKLSRYSELKAGELRAIMIGDSGVGKTAILRRLGGEDYDTRICTTISVDLKILKYDTMRLQMWDAAGQERFRDVVVTYLKKTKLLVLCISPSEENYLHRWVEDCNSFKEPSAFMLIVGTKSDMLTPEDRIDFEQLVMKLMGEIKMVVLGFVLTSAKTGEGLDELDHLLRYSNSMLRFVKFVSLERRFQSRLSDVDQGGALKLKRKKFLCCFKLE